MQKLYGVNNIVIDLKRLLQNTCGELPILTGCIRKSFIRKIKFPSAEYLVKEIEVLNAVDAQLSG